MGILKTIFGGGVSSVVDSARKTAEVFVANKTDQEKHYHAENMATKKQFASEFMAAEKKGKWNSFIDGWNRLPRPLIVTFVLASFPGSVWMIFNHPDEYILLVEALSIIPSGLWAVLSVIIAFYFGGRMHVKSQDFKVSNKSIDRFVSSKNEYKKQKELEEESIGVEELATQETASSGNDTLDAWFSRENEKTSS